MEIWQTLQEELNRLYEMFVQRNPYFEANGGKVSIAAHSLGCVVTYDILTGWTQDVEHSWYNLQTRPGGGPAGGAGGDPKRNRRFRPPNPATGSQLQATSGLLFRIENFFCLGSPLSVFLTLRWRDPSNQEYHDHILPRSLCKYLYNVYHPCDPVAYRVEPIFMKFYSKVEPVHLYGAGDAAAKPPYSDMPLQPLQNARKEDDAGAGGGDSASSIIPVNIANGSINISMGKMIPGSQNVVPKMASMSPSLSLSKMSNVIPNLGGGGGQGAASGGAGAAGAATGSAASTTFSTGGAGGHTLNGGLNQVGGAMNSVGQAAGGLIGGVFGMVKDAAAAVTPGSEAGGTTTATATATTATKSTRPGMPPVLPSSRGAGAGVSHGPFGGIGRALLPGGAGGLAGAGTGVAGSAAQQQQTQQPQHPLPSHSQVCFCFSLSLTIVF